MRTGKDEGVLARTMRGERVMVGWQQWTRASEDGKTGINEGKLAGT